VKIAFCIRIGNSVAAETERRRLKAAPTQSKPAPFTNRREKARSPDRCRINSKPFFAAKVLIKKISVADDFSDHSDLFVTNSKRFLQGLEPRVFARVTETAVKDIKMLVPRGWVAARRQRN
jgi:hypothetical protein